MNGWRNVSQIYFSGFSLFKLTYLVYRVNWLRAKARVDRWLKELILVKHEMRWTMLWFENQANLWRERLEREDSFLPIGHKAYAMKQQKIWNAFQRKASERFYLYLLSWIHIFRKPCPTLSPEVYWYHQWFVIFHSVPSWTSKLLYTQWLHLSPNEYQSHLKEQPHLWKRHTQSYLRERPHLYERNTKSYLRKWSHLC